MLSSRTPDIRVRILQNAEVGEHWSATSELVE